MMLAFLNMSNNFLSFIITGTRDETPGPGSYVPLKSWPGKEDGEVGKDASLKRTGLMRMKVAYERTETGSIRASEAGNGKAIIDESSSARRSESENVTVLVRSNSQETLEALQSIAERGPL